MAGCAVHPRVMPAATAWRKARRNESRRALARRFDCPPALLRVPREFSAVATWWRRQNTVFPALRQRSPLVNLNKWFPSPAPARGTLIVNDRERPLVAGLGVAGGGHDEARDKSLPCTTTGRAAGGRVGSARASHPGGRSLRRPPLPLPDRPRRIVGRLPLPLLRRRDRHALRPRPDRRELPRALEYRGSRRRCSATSASSRLRSTRAWSPACLPRPSAAASPPSRCCCCRSRENGQSGRAPSARWCASAATRR